MLSKLFRLRQNMARLPLVLFACLAALPFSASAGDVTSHVELLGNPYLARYTSAVNGRIVNRMRLFNNRVYFGNGTTGAQAPADLWYFDPSLDRFVKEGFIFEETIEQMRVFGDRLLIPGRDSMGQGAIYRWDPFNNWRMIRVNADGHYMDAYEFAGRTMVHASILALPYPRIAISNNDGTSFTFPGQLIDGVNFNWFSGSHWQFFEFNGNLYSTILRSSADDPNYPPTPSHPPFMVKYTGDDLAPIVRVHQHYDDFCPPGETWVISDFVEFATPSGNVGVFNGGGNLHYTTDVEAPNSATRITLPHQGPADGQIGQGLITIVKADNALYTASNVSSNGAWQIAVCKSTDAVNWTQEFHFNSIHRMRSFERTAGGDFLFCTRTNNHPDMGNILRVRAQAIAGAALPIVSVSADETTVWEGSGSQLSLRIRRAGNLSNPLVVNYTRAGTAVSGIDYQPLSGTATIPAGAHSVNVPITVIPTAANTGARTLTVTVSANAGYTIAAPSQITFTITDETAGGKLPKPGLALWLKADAGVTLASGVASAWADQSGNGFIASQANASRRPTPVTGVGGKPALRFDAGDSLDIGPLKNQIYYAAVVFANRTDVTTATAQTLLNFMSYAEGGSSGLDLGSAQTQFADETISIYQQALRAENLPAGAHRVVLSQAQHAAAFGLKIDGATRNMVSQNANRNITPTGDSFRVGSRDGASRFFDGEISEVIIYNRPLSAAEQSAIDGYLAHKYFGANQPPVAGPNTGNVNGGESLTILQSALLANDSDPDGDTFTFTRVISPSARGGTVVEAGGGLAPRTVVYTPPPGVSGTDTFDYVITDSLGLSATGRVTVTINAPPVTVADTVFRQPNQNANMTIFSLMRNDSDPEGGVLTFVTVSPTSARGAQVRITLTGVTYFAVPGMNDDDTFTYTIRDNKGATAFATVTVKTTAP